MLTVLVIVAIRSFARRAEATRAAHHDERDCPFRAEPILKKARVCKHCGRDVDALG